MRSHVIYMSRMIILPGKEKEFEELFKEAAVIAKRLGGVMWLLNPISPMGTVDKIPTQYVACCRWENKAKWEAFERTPERVANVEKIIKLVVNIDRKWFEVVVD